MVFVNEKKFACEACIKGHRSSSCHHTERPLFEVKKKGRPVSQCPKCRELRQAKRVHSKCTCAPRQSPVEKVPIPAARPDGKKPRRFMPSAPTLPNGISDAFQSASASPPPNSRQSVDSLLNPCHCKNVRQCTCRRTSCIAEPRDSSDYGLQALAEAAVMFRDRTVQESISGHSSDPPPESYCADEPPSVLDTVSPVHLELPPIRLEPIVQTFNPVFSTIPPLSTIKSIAGSGCTCGFNCTCPGCVEHRTLRHAEKHHRDCSDGCGHCVDRVTGIELPNQNTSSHDGNLVDAFFARAAALPDPPLNRRLELDDHGVAFGLVRVPKLECCHGQCGCPVDGCQCGQSCDGYCSGTLS